MPGRSLNVGCIKRDRRNTSKINHDVLDKLFVAEAQKLMNLSVKKIKDGRAPSWENHISVYEVEVPSLFGTHFRQVRNINSHVDFKRSNGEIIPLSDFYSRYHFYIYSLFNYPGWLWEVKDIEQYDFKDIERFNLSVSSHHKNTNQ